MPSIFPVIDLSYLSRANSIREYQKSIDGRRNRAADYIRNLCPRKRTHSIDFHWISAQRGVRNFIDQFCRDAERPFRFFSPPAPRPTIPHPAILFPPTALIFYYRRLDGFRESPSKLFKGFSLLWLWEIGSFFLGHEHIPGVNGSTLKLASSEIHYSAVPCEINKDTFIQFSSCLYSGLYSPKSIYWMISQDIGCGFSIIAEEGTPNGSLCVVQVLNGFRAVWIKWYIDEGPIFAKEAEWLCSVSILY